MEAGTFAPPSFDETAPLVQIFSRRGFTGGMYGGRAGREYVTRTQPDNHGFELGTVVSSDGGELIVDVTRPIAVGDGLGFEPREGTGPVESIGFGVTTVRTISTQGGMVRQAIGARQRVPAGWRVLRTADATLTQSARASYASLQGAPRHRKVALDVRVFGGAGSALKAIFRAGGEEVTITDEVPLAPAAKPGAMDVAQLREQLGRLGETPFALGAVDAQGLAGGLLPAAERDEPRASAGRR